MAELELKNVRKSYGDLEVIHGVSLKIADGEFVVLVGPSGCGKSTLLRMIAGLEKITDGEVLIDGEIANHVTAAERGLAMVFQSYALYPHMSVYKNMAFGLENTRMDRAEIDRRVRRAAEMLRITDYLQRKPRALSGGQRQRVAIGRAIVRDPKIFLFDEPLSNLDAELRVTMRKELSGLHAEIGGTMIYVTHDQVEAMTLADTIVVLRDGYVEQIGRPLDLYNRPRNRFVAGFIGSPKMNLLDGTVTALNGAAVTVTLNGDHAIPLPFGADRLSPGDPVTLGIRPEHLDIVDDGDGDDTATIAAKVDLNEQLGGETYLYCSAAGLPQLTIHQPGQRPVVRGAALRLRVQTDQAHLFDHAGDTLGRGVEAAGDG